MKKIINRINKADCLSINYKMNMIEGDTFIENPVAEYSLKTGDIWVGDANGLSYFKININGFSFKEFNGGDHILFSSSVSNDEILFIID